MNPGKIFDVTDLVPAHDEAKATAASTLKKPDEGRGLGRDRGLGHGHGHGHGEGGGGGRLVELK